VLQLDSISNEVTQGRRKLYTSPGVTQLPSTCETHCTRTLVAIKRNLHTL
jgi:hypothetical protein